MLRAERHYRKNLVDELVRNILVEQVAHRVHEHTPWLAPFERLGQFLRHQPQVEPLLVRMPRHAAPALSKRLGVAMRATRTYLRAATDRVPGGIGPFDLAVLTHLGFLFLVVGRALPRALLLLLRSCAGKTGLLPYR